MKGMPYWYESSLDNWDDLSIVDKLSTLVYSYLDITCPVLTGNMKAHITMLSGGGQYENRIRISAPIYDLKKWKKTKIINTRDENKQRFKIRSNKQNLFFHSYAYWVNEYGAFCKHNDSEHWANRAIFLACNVFSHTIPNCIVDNHLPL